MAAKDDAPPAQRQADFQQEIRFHLELLIARRDPSRGMARHHRYGQSARPVGQPTGGFIDRHIDSPIYRLIF
jgi:hypothetical protein